VPLFARKALNSYIYEMGNGVLCPLFARRREFFGVSPVDDDGISPFEAVEADSTSKLELLRAQGEAFRHFVPRNSFISFDEVGSDGVRTVYFHLLAYLPLHLKKVKTFEPRQAVHGLGCPISVCNLKSEQHVCSPQAAARSLTGGGPAPRLHTARSSVVNTAYCYRDGGAGRRFGPGAVSQRGGGPGLPQSPVSGKGNAAVQQCNVRGMFIR
jgi:hypothetical protein